MNSKTVYVYGFSYPIKMGKQVEFVHWDVENNRVYELKIRKPTHASMIRLQEVLGMAFYEDTPPNVTHSISIQTDGFIGITAFVDGKIE